MPQHPGRFSHDGNDGDRPEMTRQTYTSTPAFPAPATAGSPVLGAPSPRRLAGEVEALGVARAPVLRLALLRVQCQHERDAMAPVLGLRLTGPGVSTPVPPPLGWGRVQPSGFSCVRAPRSSGPGAPGSPRVPARHRRRSAIGPAAGRRRRDRPRRTHLPVQAVIPQNYCIRSRESGRPEPIDAGASRFGAGFAP